MYEVSPTTYLATFMWVAIHARATIIPVVRLAHRPKCSSLGWWEQHCEVLPLPHCYPQSITSQYSCFWQSWLLVAMSGHSHLTRAATTSGISRFKSSTPGPSARLIRGRKSTCQDTEESAQSSSSSDDDEDSDTFTPGTGDAGTIIINQKWLKTKKAGTSRENKENIGRQYLELN